MLGGRREREAQTFRRIGEGKERARRGKTQELGGQEGAAIHTEVSTASIVTRPLFLGGAEELGCRAAGT